MPIIKIDINEGRTYEQKAAVSKDITDSIERHFGMDSQKVMIFWTDLERHNQSIGGKMNGTPPKD